ncbi:hemolysin family protein [Cellulomonas endophytica]|uniref:hemolysin family protein n=1 Tax=Cellulomonas endophytica TaxID=2494735 RepID=UPI001011AA23|nr:hemolysin family protein [Cellulomonas endophytica]
MSDLVVGGLLALALGAIALAATLSAGEVAVGRVTRAAVAELAAEGHRAADRVSALSLHHERVQAAASYVRLVAEMTATVCLTLALGGTGLPWPAVLGLAVAVCAVLAFLLVRLSPRRLGRRHPVATLVRTWPLLVGVTSFAGGVGRPAPEGERAEEEQEEELRDMVQRVSESEAIEEEERELFRSVLELGDRLTREVMVPRPDMVTTTAGTRLDKALSLLLRSGFSRVPVVGESVDDLRGVLYLKDVVRHLQDAGGDTGEVRAADLARPPVFVPESKPVDDLLRELQSGSSHLALVVDEYGGIAGLVTIEDALEELVGELTDEHDPDAPVVERVADGVWRVPARLGRDELGELLGLEVDDEDVDSAGGLLAKALGKVPLLGSSGDIHGVHLEAERVEGRRKRLATVLVRRSDPEDAQDEDEDGGGSRSGSGADARGEDLAARPGAVDAPRTGSSVLTATVSEGTGAAPGPDGGGAR